MKTSIIFDFNGKSFDRTYNADLNQSQIEREVQFLYEDVEQYIVYNT
jgi:hypothetical protein